MVKKYLAERVDLVAADVSAARIFETKSEAEEWMKKDSEEMIDEIVSMHAAEGHDPEDDVREEVFLHENEYDSGVVLEDGYDDGRWVYLWQVVEMREA